MIADEKKQWAAALLSEKSDQLGRLPQKDDFDEVTRSRIKAYLGPWPRALEYAGLKSPRAESDSRKNKKRSSKRKNIQSNDGEIR